MKVSRRNGRRLLAVLAASSSVLAAGVTAAPPAHATLSTVSVDTLRDGWDPGEAGLSPSVVQAGNFGELFDTAVSGNVDAQPIVAGSTLVVATENNYVYGIDDQSGKIVWQDFLGQPWPTSALGGVCNDIPQVGVTSTPVLDPSTGTVYLVDKTYTGTNTSAPQFLMHALDAATGVERTGWPVPLGGSPTNAPTLSFSAFTQLQRPGLLLLGGVVYAAFGGICDTNPYRGYVMGVSTSAAKVATVWTDEATGTDAAGAIWQSGSGLVSDGAGRILFVSGNGIVPPAGPGSSPPGTLGESVVRLAVNGTDGSLSAQDFFSPANAAVLNQGDLDLGSGGLAALPASMGLPGYPDLGTVLGKQGQLFLLNRDNLGGREQGPGGTDAALGSYGPFEGEWGHAGVWPGDGGWVYYVTAGGPLRAFHLSTDGAGVPALAATGVSRELFAFGSGSPVVTSDATSSGSALVWVMYDNAPRGTSGPTGPGYPVLRAYDAVPTNGLLNLRWTSPQLTAAKFSVVASDGGRVYVGGQGHVVGFGVTAAPPLAAPPVAFGPVAVGSSAHADAVFTASAPVTVTAVSLTAPGLPTGVADPFSAAPPALPVTLSAGQTLSVPVTFAPTAATPGHQAARLQVTTSTAPAEVDLTGSGATPGLQPLPPAGLAFGNVVVPGSRTLSVDLVNDGTTSATVSSVAVPGAPFTVSGLPASGASIPAGGDVIVTVTFTPTTTGTTSTATLAVTTGSGTTSVPLSGTGVSTGKLVLTPTSTSFGSVPVGKAATASFTVSNQGSGTLTIDATTPPTGEFTTCCPLATGTTLAPGASLSQSVTFTPTASGTASGSYSITGDDGRGPQVEALSGSGTANGTLAASTTSLSSSANPSVYGQQAVSATVAAASGSGTPTGTVTFTVDGTAQPPVTLSGGVAALPGSALSTGSHTVTAAYSGDTTFAASSSTSLTQQVSAASTTTALSSSANPSASGAPVSFTALVTPVAPGAGTPTGSVTFTVDGTAQPPVALSGGSATFTDSSLSVGSHTVTASYPGSASFTASASPTLTQTVQTGNGSATTMTSSANPSVFGQYVTFAVKVTAVPPASGYPTGTVTFTVDGVSQAPVALYYGAARLIESQLSVGGHTVTAAYSGDSTFLPSSATVNQTVNQASSTTTVVSSVNPSAPGQSVTFTATVAPVKPGAGRPTGTVTFVVDGVASAPVALSFAQARLSTATLAAGSHAVSVTYNGDADFTTSTSPTLTQQVS